MLDIQTLPFFLTLPETRDEHLEICRLLAAAAISPSFCRLLLENAEQALRSGYQDETFLLSHEERDLILSIGADSLEGLARQISQTLGGNAQPFAKNTVEAATLFAH